MSLVVALTTFACTEVETLDPIEELKEVFETRDGETIVDCGGPSMSDPDGIIDAECSDTNHQRQQPYIAWTTPLQTSNGEMLYRGEVVVWPSGNWQAWQINDNREDPMAPIEEQLCAICVLCDRFKVACYLDEWIF
ncbi:MAG: hypothetical protein AAGA48_04365 [Myxococcota bacterium]